MSDQPPALSSPDPAMQTLVYTGLRALLQIAGTVGVTVPARADVSALWSIAGGVALLGAVVWSFWQKFAAALDKHRAAVQSANIGVAVK